MSQPSGQAAKPDARESEQLVDTSLPVVEPEPVDAAKDEGADSQDGVEAGEVKPAEATMTAPEAPAVGTEKQDEDDAGKGDQTEEASLRPPAESREEIENEASEHLAKRAAEMSLEEQRKDETSPSAATRKDGTLPESPPPPAPPRKDTIDGKDKGKGKGTAEQEEFDEKHPPDDPNTQEVPEAPQGTTEQTGEEIQTIMDQFDEGVGAPGEQEIMSPRLEKQQPVLQLPPRSSSLEHQQEYPFQPRQAIERRDTETFFGSPSSAKAPSISSARTEKAAQNDDGASIASHRTSIFQPPPPSPDPEPAQPFDFHRFLEQLRHRTADPVARFLRSFLQEFGKKQWAVHEQVKIIGDFLEFIAKKMAQCEVWRTVSDAEFDNAREGMEKLVMNRLYSQTFSPAIPSALGSPRKNGSGGRSAADVASPHGPGRRGQHEEDVERDTVIAQKIRIYGWINEAHLDIKPIGEKGRKFLTLAQQELLKINTYRAPRDKVICVLNACKVIFGFLKNSKSDQSADSFVPLLIYTVLRAAPEHLVSNVQYIWRFRNQDKLGGEAGYYMSSLMGVVTFIEGLDRTSLTISDEEFEHNVEQAVSAIAEGHKAEEYEARTANQQTSGPVPGQGLPGLQHLNEKSSLSRPEVTPRNSMDAERSSPRKNAAARQSEKGRDSETDDDYDAVTGLLRTIQKPLSSIGRMFSDETSGQMKPTNTLIAGSGATRRNLSPNQRVAAERGRDDRSRSRQRAPGERAQEERERARAENAAAKQASVDVEQVRRNRVREEGLVVE